MDRVVDFLSRPAVFFVLAAFIFGNIMLFSTPPMQTSDENLHYFRIYQLANRQLLPVPVTVEDGKPFQALGGEMPSNIVQFAWDFLYPIREAKKEPAEYRRELLDLYYQKYKEARLDRGAPSYAAFPNTGGYSPIPYIPQTIAVAVGKKLDIRILPTFYAARWLNLITWITITGLAIALIPRGKWLMTIIALLPVSLFQAATLSADAITNALAFLTVALFVRFAISKQKLTWKQVGFTAVVVTALSLCKSGFWPLAILFLFLPMARYSSKRTYFLANSIITGSSIIAFVWWYRKIAYTIPYIATVFRPDAGIDNALQLSYVLSNPVHLVVAAWHYYTSSDFFLSLKTGVSVMGWAEIPVPWYGLLLLVGLLVYGVILTVTEETRRFKRYQRIGAGAVLISMIGLLSATLYLTYTPFKSATINGIQGRYFIPFLPVLIPMLMGLGTKYRKRVQPLIDLSQLFLPVALIVLLIISVYAIHVRFYG